MTSVSALSSRVHDIIRRLNDNISQVEATKTCFGILAIMSREECSKIIIAKNGIDIILSGMQTHMDRADVQEAGCDLIWSLAFNNSAVKELIGSYCGAGVIVRAMKKYHTSPEFLKSACGALSNLCQYKVNQQNVASHGGIQPLIQSITIHQENAKLLPFIFDALASIIVGNEENAKIMSSLEGIIRILATTNAHKDIADVVKSGYHALAILSDVKGQACKIASAGGVASILQLLDLHPSYPDFHRVAAVVLLRMLQESNHVVKEIVSNEGIRVLLKSLDKGGAQQDTVAAITHILSTVTNPLTATSSIESQLWISPPMNTHGQDLALGSFPSPSGAMRRGRYPRNDSRYVLSADGTSSPLLPSSLPTPSHSSTSSTNNSFVANSPVGTASSAIMRPQQPSQTVGRNSRSNSSSLHGTNVADVSGLVGLIRLLSQYTERKDVARASCRFFNNIIGYNGIIPVLDKLNVMEKVTECVYYHRTNKDILETSSSILRTISRKILPSFAVNKISSVKGLVYLMKAKFADEEIVTAILEMLLKVVEVDIQNVKPPSTSGNTVNSSTSVSSSSFNYLQWEHEVIFILVQSLEEHVISGVAAAGSASGTSLDTAGSVDSTFRHDKRLNWSKGTPKYFNISLEFIDLLLAAYRSAYHSSNGHYRNDSYGKNEPKKKFPASLLANLRSIYGLIPSRFSDISAKLDITIPNLQVYTMDEFEHVIDKDNSKGNDTNGTVTGDNYSRQGNKVVTVGNMMVNRRNSASEAPGEKDRTGEAEGDGSKGASLASGVMGSNTNQQQPRGVRRNNGGPGGASSNIGTTANAASSNLSMSIGNGGAISSDGDHGTHSAGNPVGSYNGNLLIDDFKNFPRHPLKSFPRNGHLNSGSGSARHRDTDRLLDVFPKDAEMMSTHIRYMESKSSYSNKQNDRQTSSSPPIDIASGGDVIPTRMHLVYESLYPGGKDIVSRIPTPVPYLVPNGGLGPRFNHTITFDSEFESGNLLRAVQKGEWEYDLFLRADLHTPGHTQWFYFAISNTHIGDCGSSNEMDVGDEAVRVRFNIVNLTKPDSLFNLGMRPVVYSTHDAANHGIGWVRAGYHVAYYCNNLSRSNSAGEGNQTYYTLSFSMEFKNPKDTYLIAYSYPYTYSDHQAYIQQLLDRPSAKDIIRHSRLCQTIGGNDCDLLIISNFKDSENLGPIQTGSYNNNNNSNGNANSNTSSKSQQQEVFDSLSKNKKKRSRNNRKALIISGRVHPGEPPASWMMKGTLDYLTSDCPNAQLLRNCFVVYIVPMLNPDGVIYGNNRCGLAGVDLNRQWKQPLRSLHTTVYYLKNLIADIKSIREVAMYIDLHGHSRKQNIFMYGCDDKKFPNPKTRSFPKYFSLHQVGQKYVSYEDCSFSVRKGREATARVVVAKEFNIPMSYTLEATFCGLDYGPLKNCHMHTGHLEEVGAAMCDAFLLYSIAEGDVPDVTVVPRPTTGMLSKSLAAGISRTNLNADDNHNINIDNENSLLLAEDSDKNYEVIDEGDGDCGDCPDDISSSSVGDGVENSNVMMMGEDDEGYLEGEDNNSTVAVEEEIDPPVYDSESNRSGKEEGGRDKCFEKLSSSLEGMDMGDCAGNRETKSATSSRISTVSLRGRDGKTGGSSRLDKNGGAVLVGDAGSGLRLLARDDGYGFSNSIASNRIMNVAEDKGKLNLLIAIDDSKSKPLGYRTTSPTLGAGSTDSNTVLTSFARQQQQFQAESLSSLRPKKVTRKASTRSSTSKKGSSSKRILESTSSFSSALTNSTAMNSTDTTNTATSSSLSVGKRFLSQRDSNIDDDSSLKLSIDGRDNNASNSRYAKTKIILDESTISTSVMIVGSYTGLPKVNMK